MNTITLTTKINDKDIVQTFYFKDEEETKLAHNTFMATPEMFAALVELQTAFKESGYNSPSIEKALKIIYGETKLHETH
jgi:hypothetical protein